MSDVESFPLSLQCDCGKPLLEATINVESDSEYITVEHCDVVCPRCRAELGHSEDDLTRALILFKEKA